MKKLFRRLTRLELVLIYLVIVAGSVVRMTGSGMGCPDWPKCFGYIIPPTEREQLDWAANEDFQKGQIIIVDESLKVAQSDFTSSAEYHPANWKNYTKHDYAIFNPFHTWTEYINRLIGALSGVPMLILVVVSLYYFKRDWRLLALSLTGLFLLGFEAWLGKLVVDGNLIPGSITIHMMGALTIVAVLLVLLGLNQNFKKIKYTGQFRNLLLIAMILTVAQIILGTQVREEIDYLNKAGLERSLWIDNLDWQFYVHRSFSLVILAINGWLWWLNRRKGFGFSEMNAVMILIGLEILLGIFLNYLDMPKFAQPSHLVLAALLFGFQMYALIRMALSESVKVIRVG